MRKLTAFALILCMMANYVVTEEAVNELRVIFSPGVGADLYCYKKDANGNLIKENGAYVLDKKYTSNSGMEDQVEDAYNAFRTVKNYTKQVMIGHSQGGYRALGYANYLKQKGEGHMLEALICITPPARGYTPLISGRAAIAERINGLFAKIAIGLLCSTKDASAAAIATIAFSTDSILEKFNAGYVSALIDGNINSELVNDFTPGSIYVNSRINPNYSPAQGHWEKVLVGYRDPPRFRPVEEGCEIEYAPIPVYKDVWVIDRPPQITQTKMPTNMKLGFITANNKDLFSFLAEVSDTAFIEKYNSFVDVVNQTSMSLFYIGVTVSPICGKDTAAADIREATNDLNMLMLLNGFVNAGYAATEAALAVINFVGLNISAGCQNVISSGIYVGKSIGCFVGADTIAKLSDKYNTDILLTNESDGFIPTAAESRDIAEMGCQKINGLNPYVVNFFDNHNSVCYDPLIWGEGGNMCQPSNDQNALLMRWMLANGYSGWEQNYVNWMSDTNVTYKP